MAGVETQDLDRARRGTMLMFGLIIAAALLTGCGVAIWIARSGDQAVNLEKSQMLTQALAGQQTVFVDAASRIATDVGSAMAGGERPVSADVNRLLWPTGNSKLRFQHAYVLDGRLQAISAFPIGADLDANAARTIGRMLASGDLPEGRPSWSSSFDAAFLRLSTIMEVDGTPSIVAAAPIRRAVNADTAAPAMVVVVRAIDQYMLGVLEETYRLHDLHAAPAPRAGEESVPLTGTADRPAAVLAWTSDSQVSTAFALASPYWIGIALILIALAWFAARRSSRADQRLVEQESIALHKASHDALTGLRNRSAFADALKLRLDSGVPGTTVLCLDLDGFKEVNDTLGHPIGDQLLVELSARFSACLQDPEIIGRLGGDEFAIMLPGAAHGRIAEVSRRLLEAARRPVCLEGNTLLVGVTIGVSAAPEQGRTIEDLMRRADIALYEAKRRGGDQMVAFQPEFEAAMQARKALDRDLVAALPQGELFLVYQPIMSSDGTRVVGVEALMRWNHPTRGSVPPTEFIASAESSGFILELGGWALRKACEDAALWPGLTIAVNLSPIQICSPDLCQVVDRVLQETGLSADRLVLEVTEGVLIEHRDQASAAISALQSRGVRIALDDFGTGYSSLAYLKRFSFDKLKIDRSFLETLGERADDATIVHSIISLGRGLGMCVVAEGVETAEQHRFLQAAGCHEMQGYLFSRPVLAQEISERIARQLEAA